MEISNTLILSTSSSIQMSEDSSSGSHAGGQDSTVYDKDAIERDLRDLGFIIESILLDHRGRMESGRSLHNPAAGAARRKDRLYRTGKFMTAYEEVAPAEQRGVPTASGVSSAAFKKTGASVLCSCTVCLVVATTWKRGAPAARDVRSTAAEGEGKTALVPTEGAAVQELGAPAARGAMSTPAVETDESMPVCVGVALAEEREAPAAVGTDEHYCRRRG